MPRVVCLSQRPDLVPVVAAWLHGCRPDIDPADLREAVAMRALDAAMPVCLVALLGDTPVGTVSLIPRERPEDEASPWLSGLLVIPSHRRRGIGALLVREAERRAQRLGIPHLRLIAAAEPGFYAGLGWSLAAGEIGGRPIMTKRLENHSE